MTSARIAACNGNAIDSYTYYADGLLHTSLNPESGTNTYTYDKVGNLLSKLDASGTTTSHTYDQLNRVCTTTYAVGANVAATPAVNYYYDDIVANPVNYCGAVGPQKQTPPFIGSLVQVTSSASTTSVTGVDSLLRPTAGNQLTGGQLFPFSYSYNEQGSLTSETYPSGRIISLLYDASNRPTSLSGSGVTPSYVSNATYWGHGAIKSMSVGPVGSESGQYDYRLRASQITATAPLSSLSLTYQWYPNGNLQQETITPSASCNMPQYFYYDKVNRLQVSIETSSTAPPPAASCPSSGFTWCEQEAYDQFGNRTPTVFNLGVNPLAPTAFSASTNRISNSGWIYDSGFAGKNGNISGDPSNATMAFDAENRMVSYLPGSAGVAVQYTYDGQGRRVTKNVGGTPTTYV